MVLGDPDRVTIPCLRHDTRICQLYDQMTSTEHIRYKYKIKEKLLSHDDVSLNLLQYVSDFRTKLSNACEMAKGNLKSAQNSMKNRYDQNSVSRTFKPGDKVLALLPVPDR